MLKNIFIPVLLILIYGISFSQVVEDEGHSVSGIVQDKNTGSAIEFATLEILKPGDSSLVASTVSDKKGKFTLENLAAGNYIIACSFIGYERILMPLNVTKRKENVGVIAIHVQAQSMSEVTLTARRSLLNTGIDRKVYNVSQDIMAQSGSVSDLLKNIPSVEVDLEGEVSLRGSQDVLILINGRPSPLMGSSRADVLQQLPANSIERIEVITNPSARYRPDGTSGIINIVLKKNIRAGWNGTAVINAGSRDRYNGNLNMNYNPGKWNLYGTYSFRKDRRVRLNTIDRTYLDERMLPDSFYFETNRSMARPMMHMVTLGTDYIFNERNSAGVSANISRRRMTRMDVLQRRYEDRDHLLSSSSERLRVAPETDAEHNITGYWQHNFKKPEHELRTEFNSSVENEDEENRYTNNYLVPSRTSSYDNTMIIQRDHQQQLTMDYVNPLAEDKKLEAGYMLSMAQLDQDFYGEYFDEAQGSFLKDQLRTNRFKYAEAIHAIYGTYSGAGEKFGYSFGLRTELSRIRGRLVSRDSLVRNSYLLLYPTVHLSRKLKQGELQLNYSRRVNRPEGDELNPFPEYRDPYNLRVGNPKLRPEVTHSIEFGYKLELDKFSFVPSVYYRYTKDGFTSVTVPLNDSVLLTTEQNLSKDQSAGLELIFSFRPAKFLTANLSSNFFYNRIDASDLGFSSNKSLVSMASNFNATATITKTTMLQVSCNYRSPRLTPQGRFYGTFVFNSGLRQELFKKKLTLTLTTSDLFNTLRQRTELDIPGLRQVQLGRRDFRIFYFGISYRFGKAIKKQEDENLHFDNSLN